MSLTCSSSIGESAAYGGLNSAVGGITTIVLAIIGASGAKPEVLMSISIRVATPFLTEASEVDWVADRIEEVLQQVSKDAVEPLAAH
jgi:hypothetical protein